MYRTLDSASHSGSHVTVRQADEADARALARLAALDSGEVPAGPILVALRGGELVAALSVNGGRAIADPFQRTAAMIELLELRAAQLRASERSPRAKGSYAGRLRTLTRAPRALLPR